MPEFLPVLGEEEFVQGPQLGLEEAVLGALFE